MRQYPPLAKVQFTFSSAYTPPNKSCSYITFRYKMAVLTAYQIRVY